MGEVAVEYPPVYDDPAFRRVERRPSFATIPRGPAEEGLHPKAIVRKILEKKVRGDELEDAFFVADLGAVVRQHRKWQRMLPRVVREWT